MHTKLSRDDIFKMLTNSENGFEDIISIRSKVFKDGNVNLEAMKIHELVDYIIENPTILKRPIIVTEYDLQVGYNDDDITLFLPEELRDRECSFCLGPNEDCDYVKALKQGQTS